MLLMFMFVPVMVVALLLAIVIIFFGRAVWRLVLSTFGIWTPFVALAVCMWAMGFDGFDRFTRDWFRESPTQVVAISRVNSGVVTPIVSRETPAPFNGYVSRETSCSVPRTVQYVGDDGKMHDDYCATHHY